MIRLDMPNGSEPTIYRDLEQGTDEWLAARCGILTASTIGQLITPKTIKVANNDYSRALTASLVAERVTGYVEPIVPSRDMERGTLDEPYARDAYAKFTGVEVEEVGFMVRDFDGYKLGYSPDGLVWGDGLIEVKSRRQKKHLATILADEVPLENMAQVQAGLLVSGRAWCDYVSYCGGMPLYIKRVLPDPRWASTILDALFQFENAALKMTRAYDNAVAGLPVTERIDHDDFEVKEIF